MNKCGEILDNDFDNFADFQDDIYLYELSYIKTCDSRVNLWRAVIAQIFLDLNCCDKDLSGSTHVYMQSKKYKKDREILSDMADLEHNFIDISYQKIGNKKILKYRKAGTAPDYMKRKAKRDNKLC
jgi:hypothetical protein